MNELIKINEQNGNQVVSAKELYLGLGLNKSNWSRWYPTNIEKNEFFEEGVYWVGVRHNDEGNETMDFAISIEFAKHIAMMARTEKSHEYRNYFIKCEKALKDNSKQLSPMEQLRLQYQALESHEERLETLEQKFDSLEINPHQRKVIQNLKHKRVCELLSGNKTVAYKDTSFRSKVYSEMGRAYNNYFDIPSYELTPKNKFDEAIEVVKSYNLSTELVMELKKINNQVSFSREVV